LYKKLGLTGGILKIKGGNNRAASMSVSP